VHVHSAAINSEKRTMIMAGEPKTVLIVDDDASIRDFASRAFELEGYHVLQAEDGDEGLRLASTSQVALVLLDLVMPRCDGWSVMSQMKSEPALSAIPIIVFSGSAAVSQREKALSMGAADYLVKPLDVASLMEAAARILKGRR